MLSRKAVVLAVVLLFCLAVGNAPVSAEEKAVFEQTLKRQVVKFWVSPDFARDGTVFALAESWPEVGTVPEGYILYRSVDGGKTWTELRWLIDSTYREPQEMAVVRDLVFLPDGTVMLSGVSNSGTGFLCRSRDGGQRWETVVAGSDVPLNMEVAGDKLLGVFKLPRQDLTVLKVSRDGGKTWNDVRTDAVDYDEGLAVLGPDVWAVVLNGGKVAVTFDGGNTWQDTGILLSGMAAGPRRPGQPVQMVWGKVVGVTESGDTKVAVACGPGALAQVFVTRDLSWWERVEQAQFEWRPKHTASRALCVAAAPGGILFAGTPDGCVLVSGDYGRTWKPVTQGVSGEITDIKCAATGDGVVAFALVGKDLKRASVSLDIFRGEPPQLPEQPQGTKTVGKFVVGDKSYSVDGHVFQMDVVPFVEGGRTFVPIRFLAYILGVSEKDVVWDGQVVILSKAGTTLKLTVGSKLLVVNGTPQVMDVTPLLRGGRMFLPARFVAEAFGYKVNWDLSTQSIVITEPPRESPSP